VAALKILNLGTGGFIGAHLTERLLSEGYDVVGVDTHQDKISEFLDHPKLTYLNKDICKGDFNLEDLVKNADLVIDLIAYANPGIYVKRPLEVFRLNFTENLKIAEACVRYNKRLIQFSSCEVYGKTVAAVVPDQLIDGEDPRLATFSEDTTDMILGPVDKHRWIYASAKQLLERVLHAYGLEDKLNYTIVRPFNYIGPKIDYLPSDTDSIPRVFSYFMEALINGTSMKLVDGGGQRRCYTYIDDAIECIYRIVENPSNVCDQQIFNVGSPYNEVTIRQLAEKMRVIYEKKYKRGRIPLPDIVDISSEEFYGVGYEDSDRRIPDITKAKDLLGWEPKFRLEELLERTMAYYMTAYGDDMIAQQESS
jgi:nucleoside-diphosphate-sugar epimerase